MALLTASFLGYAALAASLAGTAVSAYGADQSRQATISASQYNAKLQENEAVQADMEARENERRKRIQNKAFLGSQRATIAASGVTEAGSALEALAYDAGQLELNNLDDSRAAELARQRAMNQAQQTRISGANQARAIGIGEAGTILSGLAGAAGTYGNLKYLGAIKR